MFNLIGNFGLNLTPLPTQSVSQQGGYNCTYLHRARAATKSALNQRHCFYVFIFFLHSEIVTTGDMDHWKLCPVPVQLGVPSALN